MKRLSLPEGDKGLFYRENVFDSKDYEKIIRMVKENEKKGKFEVRQHAEDNGIEFHPLWFPNFPFTVQKLLHDFVNSTELPILYGFNEIVPLEAMSASFILKYSSDDAKLHQTAFSYHRDESLKENVHIMSVIFTIRSPDCLGGTLKVSRRDDGLVVDSADVVNFVPQNNSIYALNGNYVGHCAMGINQGEKYSIVMFYETSQRKIDVVMLWNNKPLELICNVCYCCFDCTKSVRDHRRKQHGILIGKRKLKI